MRLRRRKYLTHKQMLALSEAQPGEQPLPGWTVAFPGTRFYGGGGTIHQTSVLNVETYNGEVVSVWFRCQMLPFTQRDVGAARAGEMMRAYDSAELPEIVGLELIDP